MTISVPIAPASTAEDVVGLWNERDRNRWGMDRDWDEVLFDAYVYDHLVASLGRYEADRVWRDACEQYAAQLEDA